jgi:hypothetical protein
VVLRRIAQAGLTGLSGMINGTATPDGPAVPPPRSQGPAIADLGSSPPSTALSVGALGYSAH